MNQFAGKYNMLLAVNDNVLISYIIEFYFILFRMVKKMIQVNNIAEYETYLVEG